jgi:competence protein ComEC
LGILVVASPCIEFVERKQYINNKFLFGVFSASLISISATIFTAPVAIYYFGYISNVSLITNLLVCTPATVALCLAVLGIIFVPFGKVFFLLSEIIVKYVNAVINYFGSLIFAATDLPFFAVYFAVGIIIILLCVLLACKKRLNVLKLTEMNNKRIKEGGGKIRWRSYTKKI